MFAQFGEPYVATITPKCDYFLKHIGITLASVLITSCAKIRLLTRRVVGACVSVSFFFDLSAKSFHGDGIYDNFRFWFCRRALSAVSSSQLTVANVCALSVYILH